jgi:hypothetical protein
MEYLIKKKLFKDKVVLDCDQMFVGHNTISKARELEIDRIMMEKLNPEIEKIKNGTSSLIQRK